jgi:hypothetical protein
MSADKGTTEPGYINIHGQEVIHDTGKAGTDHEQRAYELRCQHCGHHYGSNGSDNHQRKCLKCQGGAFGPAL